MGLTYLPFRKSFRVAHAERTNQSAVGTASVTCSESL